MWDRWLQSVMSPGKVYGKWSPGGCNRQCCVRVNEKGERPLVAIGRKATDQIRDNILLKLFCKLDLRTPWSESTLRLSSSGTRTTRCRRLSLMPWEEGQTQFEHFHWKHLQLAAFMKHEQNTFLKLFWRKFSDSWTCLDFPNVSWYKGNVAYACFLPWLNAALNVLCSFWQTDYADFWCTGIIIFYKFFSVCLFFFSFGSWELKPDQLWVKHSTPHCHFSPAVQSMEEGQDKYYTNQPSYLYNDWTIMEKLI